MGRNVISRTVQLIVTIPGNPPKPTGLSSSVVSDQWVTLNWDQPNNANVSEWQYRQKTGSDPYSAWTKINGSGRDTTSHTIAGLTASTACDFQIRFVAGGNSPASDEISVSTQAQPQVTPAKPSGLTTLAGDKLVELNWDNPSNTNITGYQIRYKLASDTYGSQLRSLWTDIPGSGSGTVTHTVTGLLNGTAYSFQLRAVGAISTIIGPGLR